VEAAQQLRATTGAVPSVEETAAAAGVSRATAYRYFPSQETLELEVADISPDVAATEAALEHLATDDLEARLIALLEAFNPILPAKEEHFRRALWVYQDTWLRSHRNGEVSPAVREGRRMRWLDQVLEPATTLPGDRKRRLLSALALTLGGDAFVVMKDVCHLGDDEALDVLRWAALAILRAGLAEEQEPRST
jgi:AcrR family transcriptional regulator